MGRWPARHDLDRHYGLHLDAHRWLIHLPGRWQASLPFGTLGAMQPDETRHLLAQFWIVATSGVWQMLAACAALIIVELAWPRGPAPLHSRLRGVSFRLCLVLPLAARSLLFYLAIGRMHLTPYLPAHAGAAVQAGANARGWAAALLAPLAGIAIWDFLEYWQHRALHAVPALWRIHRVHHAISEINAANSFVHILEACLKLPLATLFIALCIGTHAVYTPLILFVLAAHGPFQHAATTLNLGGLGYVLSDNRFHRIHHGQAPELHNCNFGTFTTLWDVVFRTARFPKPGEWPQAGLSDLPEVRTLSGFILAPLAAPQQA